MKAAILYNYGEVPRYGEIAEPIIGHRDQVMITMCTAAVKNLDKSKASGAHYSAAIHLEEPIVVGVDGVGELQDGTRVYAFGLSGMVAEKALAARNYLVPLPEGLDNITAAALPNAVMGAAAALRFKGEVKKGDVVLINGATGFTGMLAVQLAKYYGAAKVIVTGRNIKRLHGLLEIGADVMISLKDDDKNITRRLTQIHAVTPINIVIDYLWGHSAELILSVLGGVGKPASPVRFVTVGGMAGDKLQLSSSILRSSDLTLVGSGPGSLSDIQMALLFGEIIPEMFELAARGKLTIQTETAELRDIETAWNKEIPAGTRLVIVIDRG